jgi:hypothetical protein
LARLRCDAVFVIGRAVVDVAVAVAIAITIAITVAITRTVLRACLALAAVAARDDGAECEQEQTGNEALRGAHTDLRCRR